MLQPSGLSPVEAACGMPFGGSESVPPPSRIGVFEALALDLIPAAEHGPLVVWVSGDDGTAIVAAAAVEAARRVGGPSPVAITPTLGQNPPDPYAGRVVAALGIRDWERPTVGPEFGLLGPVAQDILRRYGPIFPSIACMFVPMLAAARGGTFVSGHSLHEGWHLCRIARVSKTLSEIRERKRIRRRDLRVLSNFAPLLLRRRLARGLERAVDVPYLRPAFREAARTAMLDDLIAGPLRSGTAGQMAVARFCGPGALAVYDRLAADQKAAFVFAWMSPRVGAALNYDLGFLGPPTPSAFRRNVVPFLPDRDAEHISPQFGWAWEHPDTGAFIDSWDGTGIDDELVDPEALRLAWRRRDWRSGILLQTAWLASDFASARPRATAVT